MADKKQSQVLEQLKKKIFEERREPAAGQRKAEQAVRPSGGPERDFSIRRKELPLQPRHAGLPGLKPRGVRHETRGIFEEEHLELEGTPPEFLGRKTVKAPSRKVVEGVLEVFESPFKEEERAAAKKTIESKGPSEKVPERKGFPSAERVREAGTVEAAPSTYSPLHEKKLKASYLSRVRSLSKEFAQERSQERVIELASIIPKSSELERDAAVLSAKEKGLKGSEAEVESYRERIAGVKPREQVTRLEFELQGKSGSELYKELERFYSAGEIRTIRGLVEKLSPTVRQYAREEIKAALVLEGVPERVARAVMVILYDI